MNLLSSRSHSIFTLRLTKSQVNGQPVLSKLHLVDLAGSERIGQHHLNEVRLHEAKKINQSLTELSNVIIALGKKKSPDDFVQYRNSKLTRLLEDSLGGNTFTSFIATVSPSHSSLGETLSTLGFASRALRVKVLVSLNRPLSNASHLKVYERF